MSRAVIDQAGYKVVFIGILISLLLGLTLKSQIAPQRIHSLLQDSVSLLEKDFIIDFQKTEIILSKWGLPLPYLQISQIRLSPKKAACQDSQMYIENLILPLSPLSLMTSQTLVREIQATQVELRISDWNNCIQQKTKSAEKNPGLSPVISQAPVTNGNGPALQGEKEIKNVFQVKTAALLEKIKIDQLKFISKKYPTQPISLRQVNIDLTYQDKQLEKIDLIAQMYALKDLNSDLMFFKGELALQMNAKVVDQIETQAKLRGRLLDGEIQLYSIYNSPEQNIKMDFSARNVAIKPLIQMNLIESSWLNYPVALNFRGYGQYQVDGSQLTLIKLKDIDVAGDRTHIRIPEVNLKNEKNQFSVDPFTAVVQSLNLNRLAQIQQMRSVAPSIENFGEINGVLQFKDKDHMTVTGVWSGLEFIFSNRGVREFQRVDSFQLQGNLVKDVVDLKLNKFFVNNIELLGKSEIHFNHKSSEVQAEAQLEGELLNERVWGLWTQVAQRPHLKLNWNYRKNTEERHQVLLSINKLKAPGAILDRAELNYIHNLSQGISSAISLSARVHHLDIDSEELITIPLKELFSKTSLSEESEYVSDQVFLNLKGSDWKSMNYELDSRLKPKAEGKRPHLLKIRGDWKEDETVSGILSIQNANQLQKFEIRKNEDYLIELIPQ